MYNIVEPGRARRAPRRQARQGLRRQRRPGLDPRGADRRDVLLGRPEHAAAAAHHAGGLALRPDAADELGRRARPRGPGHRGGDQGAGRGRAVRLRLRPWRCGRRLREHLGHRQALLRRHEGEEHPHPQPPGLQLRGPRHPRHGRGRAQQLLRGRRARRHDLRRRHQRARDPDQLLPRPLGPEPARHLAGEEAAGDAGRAAPAGPDRHRRPAPDRDGGRLRGRGRHGRGAAPAAQLRHRPGALQRAAHLRRRAGLARPRVHRREHQGLRGGARRPTAPASRRRRGSPASAPTTSSRRRTGSPSPRRAASGAGRCSATRRG